jgi:CRP-like cAMP-binding protein
VLAQVSVDGAVLGTKQMGDTLGEMALVSSQKRAADVLAISLCELAVLRRDDYLTVVSEKQNETLELKRELIRANPLVGCLTRAQRDELSKLGKLQRFACGETIIRQADGSDVH